MKRRIAIASVLMAYVLSLGVSKLHGCTWAVGYFYQVTNLRGTVVGSKFPLLHSFRWFRQSTARPGAKLSLFHYCRPCDIGKLVSVKTTTADSNGKFDFGILAPDHYYLRVVDDRIGLPDWFEVEVKPSSNPKETVTIDISPVSPDCSGGHEFIVNSN